MKSIAIAVILCLPSYGLFAQAHSKGIEQLTGPLPECMVTLYNPQTKTMNSSYQYADRWDLDGDGLKDTVWFVGNGGAHTYYYLRVKLSSKRKAIEFPFLQLDMPYLNTKEQLVQYKHHPGIQFVIHDFDGDGVSDIYLNADNTFSAIPTTWKRRGVHSLYVIMTYRKGALMLRDY